MAQQPRSALTEIFFDTEFDMNGALVNLELLLADPDIDVNEQFLGRPNCTTFSMIVANKITPAVKLMLGHPKIRPETGLHMAMGCYNTEYVWLIMSHPRFDMEGFGSDAPEKVSLRRLFQRWLVARPFERNYIVATDHSPIIMNLYWLTAHLDWGVKSNRETLPFQIMDARAFKFFHEHLKFDLGYRNAIGLTAYEFNLPYSTRMRRRGEDLSDPPTWPDLIQVFRCQPELIDPFNPVSDEEKTALRRKWYSHEEAANLFALAIFHCDGLLDLEPDVASELPENNK